MEFKNYVKLGMAAAAAFALAGCVIEDGGGGGGGGGRIVDQPAPNPTPTPPPGMNKATNVSWGIGESGRVIQRFERGNALTSDVRVCFINNSGGKAELRHNVPSIPALTASAGGKPCARFPSSLRVQFQLITLNTFKLNVTTLRYNLAPLEGGNLRLTFEKY